MTAYADEEFYNDDYLCGRTAKITTAFDYYARSATYIIKAYTGENVDGEDVPDCVRLCCCELAELIYEDEQAGSQTTLGITSAKVGDESVTYESGEAKAQSLRRGIRRIIYKYLADTDLLYRGVIDDNSH